MKWLFGLLSVVIVLLLTQPSFAQEVTQAPAITIPSPISSPSSALQKEVAYQLPYPGLLPDSPFYVLKTLRDRIIGFLIASPVKKAEFDILQADKRLQVGVSLLQQKGKESLAESTISKGENYYIDALNSIKDAKKQGMASDPLITKMILSTRKHQEVLLELEQKVSSNYKKKFHELSNRAKSFEQQTQALK